MKKCALLFVVFALLQFSCTKDDDEGDKSDQVFQKSELVGFWRNIAQKANISDHWDISVRDSNHYSLVEFKEGEILYDYDLRQNPYSMEEGTWSFDGKNLLNYTLKDGTRYELKMMSILGRVLTAEVTVIRKDGSRESGIWLFDKIIESKEEYYQQFTGGYKVKDINNFRVLSVGPNYVSGVKDNKLWIGFFDRGEQISEKKDKEDFSFTKTVYKGYGEYGTYTVRSVYVEKVINDDLIMLNYNLHNEKDYYVNYLLWFTNSGKKIDLLDPHSRIVSWYEGSHLVYSGSNLACLSQQGDTIYSAKADSYYDIRNYVYPVNHNYYIEAESWNGKISLYLKRFVDDNNPSWDGGGAVRVEAEEDNFIYTITPGNKGTSTWTFQIDITEYSGKKHSHTVDIDISGIKN